MPGRTPQEAVQAFLDPLGLALACAIRGKLVLTPGARGDVGETHSWTLNGGDGADIGDRYRLRAAMHFEVLDRGASLGDERYKVSTRGYMYGINLREGRELLGVHWHPTGSSHHRDPHLHLDEAAISDVGVFLARAPLPTSRLSFEWMIRWAIENLPGVTPLCDDWAKRLEQTEALFAEHKSW